MNFMNTLLKHMEYMQKKDLAKFISTVNLEEIVLIMPNGSYIDNPDDFTKLHEEWFKDNDWSITYRILKVLENSEVSHAIIDIDYSDCDEEGNLVDMKYYLNLIFKLEGEEWKLVHDQNTIHK